MNFNQLNKRIQELKDVKWKADNFRSQLNDFIRDESNENPD